MNAVTLSEQILGGAFKNINLICQFDIVEYTFKLSNIDFVRGVFQCSKDISTLNIEEEFRKNLSIYKSKAEIFYIDVYLTNREKAIRLDYYNLELAHADYKKIREALEKNQKNISQSL